MHFTNFVRVQINLIRLTIKEIKTGVKYAKSRYSGEIMGSIVVSVIPLISLPLTYHTGYLWCLYEVRKAFSMHKTLTINIVLSNKTHTKGRDIIPAIGAFLGRIGNGPLRKKFVKPNELAIVLDIKVINGSAWSRFAKDDIV